jgi:hypothetical protein
MRAALGNRYPVSVKERFGVLLLAAAVLVMMAGPQAHAQGAPPAAAASTTPPPADEPPPALSSDQLDQLCAPIALYPDALLAQVLMASAYPLDVVAADRFMQKNGSLSGEQMEAALEKQPWDISVKTLTHFPSVLKYMDENLDWTQALGDAFVNQQADVMASIQHLRSEAYAVGNLKTSPQQTVTMDNNNIIISPTDGQTIYVPQYDPQVVYTQGPTTVVTTGGTTTVVTQPTTTVVTQPGYSSGDLVATGLLSFGAGILVGSLINNDCNWGGGYVYAPYYRGNYYGWGHPPAGWNNNGWQHNGNNNINIGGGNTINIGNGNGNGNGNGANRPWKPNNDRRPPMQNGRPGQVRPPARDFGYGNGKPGGGASTLPANIKPGNNKPGGGGAFGGYGNGNNTLQSSTRGQQSLGGNNGPGGGTKPAKPAGTKPAKPAPTKPIKPATTQPNRGGGNGGGGLFGGGGNGGGNSSYNRNAGQRGGNSMGSAKRNGFKPPKGR